MHKGNPIIEQNLVIVCMDVNVTNSLLLSSGKRRI